MILIPHDTCEWVNDGDANNPWCPAGHHRLAPALVARWRQDFADYPATYGVVERFIAWREYEGCSE